MTTPKEINYELCKELKEVGFPQDKTEWILYTIETMSATVNSKDYYALRGTNLGELPVSEVLAAPTLSELIKACGEVQLFVAINGYSVATKSNTDSTIENYQGEGKTPEEAVAKLYIVLKK